MNGRLASFLVFALAGCGSGQPADHPVVGMAEFDLECPRENLLYTSIDTHTLGVQGCGRRARYIMICREVSGVFGPEDECRWVMN